VLHVVAQAQAIIAEVQRKLNELWAAANLPQFIQWGKDEQGSHSHAMNGPTIKAVFARPELIKETFRLMEQVWELHELAKANKAKLPATAAVATDDGKGKGKGVGAGAGAGKGKKGARKPKAQKQRGVQMDEPGDSDDEDDALAGDDAAPCRRPPHLRRTRPGWTRRGQTQEQKENDAAVKELTIKQRAGAAFLTIITFYQFIHSRHNRRASEITQAERDKLAKQAVGLALAMQRAMLALMGSHKRRTYAHDLVYGMYNLYRLFGRPWNAATEGSEHAHQEMKKYFLTWSVTGARGTTC
jgi:hypothetical protein